MRIDSAKNGIFGILMWGSFLFFFTSLLACQINNKVKKDEVPVNEIIKFKSGEEVGITSIASHLKVPWDIEWGPDGNVWFTIQEGKVDKIDPHTGKIKELLDIRDKVYKGTTPGLLGMAIYDKKDKHYVFIAYQHKNDKSNIVQRLVRYDFTKDTLINPKILLEFPSAKHHTGSRIVISPNRKVFLSTGDANSNSNAQDTSVLAGKILRINMDGSIPYDNPFANSPVWSLGHRNPQGLAFTSNGKLLSSEHGPATDDEINLIEKGRNYGWPEVLGYCNLPKEKVFCDSFHVREPLKAWTPTIAPAGIAYYGSDIIPKWNNSILLTTLKGESLRILKLNNEQDSIISETILFEKKFGRLRDVCVSPNGDIYLSTSNRDWRHSTKPRPKDNRIIRISKIRSTDNLSKVKIKNPISISQYVTESSKNGNETGLALYQSYCASCHQTDGNGVKGSFPALNKNKIVNGDQNRLIEIVLKGDKAIKEKFNSGQKMPAFDFLKDEQTAKILSYIRSAWNNHTGIIEPDEIKASRK